MNSKPHDATTAIAWRIFEQSKKGVRVTVVEMAKIVEWMEQKDQALSEARAELARLSEVREAAVGVMGNALRLNGGGFRVHQRPLDRLVAALSHPAAEQPAPETFVGVTESGHYSYHDCAKSSRHGWMQCTACRSPITSGEYRTREHADRYATWHRDCCPDDPHWRERDAMSQTAAERIEDYNERGQEGRE